MLADAQDPDRVRDPGIHAVQIVIVDGILLEAGQAQCGGWDGGDDSHQNARRHGDGGAVGVRSVQTCGSDLQ